jgi:hypothetical protein
MANPARGHFSSHTNTSNTVPYLSLKQLASVSQSKISLFIRAWLTFNVNKAPNKTPIVTHPPPLGHLAVLRKPHSLEPNSVLPIAEELAEKAKMKMV